MKKIIILALSLLLLTGCTNNPTISSDSNNVDNEIKNTITKYIEIKTYTGEDITFDKNDTKTFDGETYSRILGDGFNNVEDYNKMINSTFTKETVKYNLLKDSNSFSAIKSDDGKIYISNQTLEHINQYYKDRPLDLDNLKVISKKDDILIVGFTFISETNIEDRPISKLVFIKENDKYLIHDDISKLSYNAVSEDEENLIRKHFNIPDDKSTFIGNFNNSFPNKKYNHSTYGVFEINGKTLTLKEACDINKDTNKVKTLKVEGENIVNNIFEDIPHESDDVELLICYVPEDKANLTDDYIEYSFMGTFDENPKSTKVNNKYIVIPKYINDPGHKFEIDGVYHSSPTFSLPIYGVEGDIKIKFASKEYNLEDAKNDVKLLENANVVNYDHIVKYLTKN